MIHLLSTSNTFRKSYKKQLNSLTIIYQVHIYFFKLCKKCPTNSTTSFIVNYLYDYKKKKKKLLTYCYRCIIKNLLKVMYLIYNE